MPEPVCKRVCERCPPKGTEARREVPGVRTKSYVQVCNGRDGRPMRCVRGVQTDDVASREVPPPPPERRCRLPTFRPWCRGRRAVTAGGAGGVKGEGRRGVCESPPYVPGLFRPPPPPLYTVWQCVNGRENVCGRQRDSMVRQAVWRRRRQT